MVFPGLRGRVSWQFREGIGDEVVLGRTSWGERMDDTLVLVKVTFLPIRTCLGCEVDRVGMGGHRAGQSDHFQEAVRAGVVRREREWRIVIMEIDPSVRIVWMREVSHRSQGVGSKDVMGSGQHLGNSGYVQKDSGKSHF